MTPKQSAKFLERFRVNPGTTVQLKKHDPAWRGDAELRRLSSSELKGRAKTYLDKNRDELAEAQEVLWASDTYSVLVVLQAMDCAGKDGLIKHVMSGVNPQGCGVVSFKQPSAEELDHTFLWRAMKALPERGKIVLFNRSYYEDVLVVKVHPELLDHAKLPDDVRSSSFWDHRYNDINAMEHHLVRNGTRVVKLFLHMSKGEQRKRLLERLDDPEKHWKFSLADLKERGYWKDYQRAYEEMLSATSTRWAPWHVLPADNKWVCRALAAAILTREIRSLKIDYPKVTDEQHKALAAARKQLMGEGRR